MATAVTRFVSLFREMRLSTATVQREEVSHGQISHGQISVLFWINATMGLATSLAMFLLARRVAWFYGVPDLASLVRVLSLGPVIGGLAVQHGALLDQQMRSGTKAAINPGSVFVGALVAVALAWWGAGCWALALDSPTEDCASTAARW